MKLNKRLLILPICSLFICSCSNNTQNNNDNSNNEDKSYQNEETYKFIIKSIKTVKGKIVEELLKEDIKLNSFEAINPCKYVYYELTDACFFPIKLVLEKDNTSKILYDLGFSFYPESEGYERWLFGTSNYGNLDYTGSYSNATRLYNYFESNELWDVVYTAEQINEGLKTITY